MSLQTTNSDSAKLKTFIIISVLVATAAAVGFGLFGAPSKSSHKKKVASIRPSPLKGEDEKEKKAEKDAVKDEAKSSLNTHSKSVPAATSAVANPSPKPASSSSPARSAPSPRSASSPGKSYAKAASPAAVSVSSGEAQSAASAIRSSSVAGPVTTSSSSLKTDSFFFHPEFDEMSNFFYKNANGETCSVYSLLTTESDAAFETLLSKKFPYKYDDDDRDNHPLKESKQDHKDGKPNGINHPSQPDSRSKHPKVSPKAKDHENVGSELAESLPLDSTTFSKHDEEEEDEKTAVLNLLNKTESPSSPKLPVMEPVVLDQEAKDDAEIEILESLESVTESLSSSSTSLEAEVYTPEYESLLAPIPPATLMNTESAGTEKIVSEEERLVNHSPIAVFDVSQVAPAAEASSADKQINALNVQANEFVPSCTLPGYPVQSSFAYQDVQYAGHASGYYDYQFQGYMFAGEYNEMDPSWNPYAVAGQGMTILFFSWSQHLLTIY